MATMDVQFILIHLFLCTFTSANLFFLEPNDKKVIDVEETYVDTTLNCKANLTRAQYRWTKDGEVITTKGRYQLGKDGTLSIFDFDASDMGKYHCLASNHEGTALSNVGLIVAKYFNKFSDNTRSPVETKLGVGVKLTCDGANFSPENSVYFSWEKKVSLKRFEVPGTPEYYVSQTDGTLYLSNPTIDDSDVYSCYITTKKEHFNIHREHHSPGVDLSVTGEKQDYAPEIMLHLKQTTYVEVGETAVLECFASGNPTPNIVWRKVNGQLPSSHVITSAGQLEINDVTVDMSGVYECEAKNKLGSVMSSGRLEIKETPTWRSTISTRIVQHGETVKFHCKALGIPSPNYRWLKNGELLDVTSRMSVGTEGGSVMTIAEVSDDDVAIYQCVAENIAGSLYSNAKLSLKDNVFSQEPSDQYVTLAGEPKQVQFECESNLKECTYQWLKDGIAITTNNNKYQINKNGTLKIIDLLASDAGNYQCLATSKEGSALSNAGKLVIEFMNYFGSQSKTSYTTEAGEGIAIPCEGANFGPENSVYFFWESVNAFIIYGKPGRADYYVSQNGTLYFANPTTDLTDNYFCFIRDKWNLPSGRRIEKSSRDIYLTVTKSRERNPPTILLKPKNVTYAEVGSTVMLECFAGGNPTPALKWTKVNGSLPTNHVITDAGQLEIRNVTYDVTGTYRCTASNDLGIAATKGDVIVSEPLFLKRRIFSQNVDFHETATFRCEAAGFPPPKYKWLKNGAPIEMTLRVSESVGTEGGSVMTITEVGDDDVAIYQCVAENPLEILISNAALRIPEMTPEFLTPVPELTKALVESDLTLKCAAIGYPKPTIHWTENDNDIVYNVRKYNKSDGSLVLRSLSKSDEGEYCCTAANLKEKAKSCGRLEVFDRTKLTIIPADISILVGESIYLDCNVTVDQRFLKVEWEWFFDRKTIDIYEEHIKRVSQTKVKLMEVTKSEQGIYKCCAIVDIDRRNRTCANSFITVKSPPNEPDNVNIDGSGSTWQLLTWKAPDDNGDAITHYSVELLNEYGQKWNPAGKTNQNQLNITYLLPFNGYKYRVSAHNVNGRSVRSGKSKFARTRAGEPPHCPTELQLDILENGKLRISWEPIEKMYWGASKLLFYNISIRDQTKSKLSFVKVDSGMSSYLYEMQPTYTNLYIAVSVANDKGSSRFSEPQSTEDIPGLKGMKPEQNTGMKEQNVTLAWIFTASIACIVGVTLLLLLALLVLTCLDYKNAAKKEES